MANSSFRLQPSNPDEYPEREVFAGWDEGINTYYANVYNGVDANFMDRMDLDVGRTVFEIQSAVDLIDMLRPYAEIPDGFAAILEDSRVADGAWTYDDLRPPESREDIDESLDTLTTVHDDESDDIEDILNGEIAQTARQDSTGDFPADDSLGNDEGLNAGLGY